METICVPVLTLPPSAPLPSQPRLVGLSGRGACQLHSAPASSHTPPHPPRLLPSEPQGAQGMHHPQVMAHQPPLLFLPTPINHLFLVICMATLLHWATQGSFLVSLPYLTLTSWVTLDSPATPPRPGLCGLPACAPGVLVFSRAFPSYQQARLCSQHHPARAGRLWAATGPLEFQRMPSCSGPNRLSSPLWVTLFHPRLTDGDTGQSEGETCRAMVRCRDRSKPWGHPPRPSPIALCHLCQQKIASLKAPTGVSEKCISC